MDIQENQTGLCVAVLGNIFMNVWAGEVTVARLQRVLDLERGLVRGTPDGICVLSVIRKPGRMATLGDAEREFVGKFAVEMAPHTRASCYVIQGSGFWVATARTVIAGVQWLAPSRFPQNTVSSVDEAATWLSPHTRRSDGAPISPRDLTAHITGVLERHDHSHATVDA
ncbi:MAG: hypothetical protein AB2A00_37645 [Myxococcota bacterium]